MPPVHPWFDAHLDLACLAVTGRDMLAHVPAPDAPPSPPGCVTLPTLAAGRVRFALATIFTEPGGDDAASYPKGDFARAHAAGRAQLEVYLTWRDRGLVGLDLAETFAPDPGVGPTRGGLGVGESIPEPPGDRLARLPAPPGAPSLRLAILMENADPIREVSELGWWVERGLRVVGLTWARSSRFAGGNTTDDGLTAEGRELVAEIDRMGVLHDASHLCDRALDDLFAATPGRVVASHSNCRALLDGRNQRHLTDRAIAEVVRRGGVIGLNLCSRFLRPAEAPRRATLDEALAHVEHVCAIAGPHRAAGLGSDMDGGFSRLELPEGIDAPRDLDRLGEGLRRRGWGDEAIHAFAWGNWARVLGEHARPV